MKARELRIGNYYNYNGDIREITPLVLLDLYNSNERDWFSPIPLTEEWLLRLGFGQGNGIMSFVKEEYSNIKITYETIADYYRLYPYTNKIKYVHQLQNLYHALTSEELTLKETTL